MRNALLTAASLLAVPLIASAASIEAIRLGRGFAVSQLPAAVPALQALEPAVAQRLWPSAQALLAATDVAAVHDDSFFALIPLQPSPQASTLIIPLKSGGAHSAIAIAGELAERVKRYAESRDFDAANEALSAVFDLLRPPRAAAPLSVPTRPHIPFPSLAGTLAQNRGLQRETRPPVKLLPSLKDARSLPRGMLGTVLMRMASRQNWGDVSYGASNIRSVEDKVRAQWMYEDAKADVRDLLAQLTPEQQEIAEAAFQGGMAETPLFRSAPDDITLAWVREHYPTKLRKTPGGRGRAS